MRLTFRSETYIIHKSNSLRGVTHVVKYSTFKHYMADILEFFLEIFQSDLHVSNYSRNLLFSNQRLFSIHVNFIGFAQYIFFLFKCIELGSNSPIVHLKINYWKWLYLIYQVRNVRFFPHTNDKYQKKSFHIFDVRRTCYNFASLYLICRWITW